MILDKNTVIKPLILGIYISVEFNYKGELINYKEIDTDYLKNIDVNVIKDLIGNCKAGTHGVFKAVLTIKPDNLSIIFSKYKISIYQTIADCLYDEQYKKYITFMMFGYMDDIDHFDKYYDCTLCKYFLNFNRCPKIKLRESINEEEFIMIINKWLDFYLFNKVVINGKEIYDLITLADKQFIIENTIMWKESQLHTYELYICDNVCLSKLYLPTYYLTHDVSVPKNAYYSINNKIIISNANDVINNFLNNNDLIINNGKIIKKGSELNGFN